jgi:hypothetical protein
MPPDVAAGAFGHCSAVLRRADVAEDAATVAVRRGGRSRLAVLAHARHQCLVRLDADPAPVNLDSPPDDLADLAWRLAGTRPAEERAVIDLDGRHGLDRAGVGRALGLASNAAAARVAEVAETWERELDPSLLAYLGPGECDELATVLEDRGLWTREAVAGDDIGDHTTGDIGAPTYADLGSTAGGTGSPVVASAGELAAVGADVAAHVQGCEQCADRRRAMVSTRALVAQMPLPTAPAAVMLEARRARRRLPGTPPPSIDGGGRRLSRTLVAAAIVVAVLAVATGAGAKVLSDRRTDAHRRQRIAALTKVPGSGSALTVSPASLTPAPGVLTLTNRRASPLAWKAVADVPWITLSPSTGHIGQAGTVAIAVALLPSSPEGRVHATITVTAEDGSAAAAEVSGTVQRPPQVSATIAGCRITAVTDDQAPAVTLHWTLPPLGPVQSTPMAKGATAYTGDLPSAPLSWWVEVLAADGGKAQTPQRVLDAPCAATP